MKLHSEMRNERGGKKSTSDDTRIIVELSYKNKILGRVGLYAIIDDKKEGFRVIWDEEGKGYDPDKKPLLELEQDKKGKDLKGENYTLGECIVCDAPLSKDKTCPFGC